MHTHFASATHGAATFLVVLLFGTLYRLLYLHGLLSKSEVVRGLSRAASFQY